MTITVNADLFRIVSAFTSKDIYRKFMTGVLIESHPDGGANLIATDGHRMLVAHDGEATAPASPIIVKLGKALLEETKNKKSEPLHRLISVDANGASRILSGFDDRVTLIGQHDTIIDGVFPDWQSIVPPVGDVESSYSPSWFNANYIKTFAVAANELARLRGETNGVFRVSSRGGKSSLVELLGDPHVFGVIWPVFGPLVNHPK